MQIKGTVDVGMWMQGFRDWAHTHFVNEAHAECVQMKIILYLAFFLYAQLHSVSDL